MSPPLLTALDSGGHVHLVIGSNPLANARCTKSLEVGAKPIVISPAQADIHYVLAQRIESGEVQWIKSNFEDTLLTTLGREAVDHVVDAVFITSNGKDAYSRWTVTTLHPLSKWLGLPKETGVHVSQLCRRKRIPINVVDAPNLCTFTLLSTHSDGPLQIGITTSGKGCKLASRIRREVATLLPPKFGDAVERLGTIRRRIWEEDHKAHDVEDLSVEVDESYSTSQRPNFNRLVSEDDIDAARTRRMRWLAQICEYWPLRRLSSITDADIENILQAYGSEIHQPHAAPGTDVLDARIGPKARIILAGSGPGSPALLTLATQHAIQTASVILADKLVPEGVLNLIPRRTTVHIARKFPGNADAAQEELLTLGLEALRKGHTVLRLKQGDPYLYGRGAEEYAYFQDKGYQPIVIPGITSALSGPLFANIPPTHRSVADQVLICTGTGRKGATPDPPPYIPSQTVVFLMALHRLTSLVESLIGPFSTAKDNEHAQSPRRWPRNTPCVVIERASCPDQRVLRSTLEHVCLAIEEEGSRPPGLLVVGWSCGVLKDLKGASRWIVEEGFSGFNMHDEGMEYIEKQLVDTGHVSPI